MHDYTGPHDYFDPAYVNDWTGVANTKRPFRVEFFEAIVSELAALRASRVLDVGSGPGFLAERVLDGSNVDSYHLFDFSPYMLALSRARLQKAGDRAVFHQGSFLEEGWWRSLPGPYDAIVSMQAIHEVRKGRLIPKLYAELRLLLKDGGIILIADEVNDSERQEQHLLTLGEHKAAMLNAGFEKFRLGHAAGDLVLFAANKTSGPPSESTPLPG
jgi:SAM-dependent methyltransferase